MKPCGFSLAQQALLNPQGFDATPLFELLANVFTVDTFTSQEHQGLLTCPHPVASLALPSLFFSVYQADNI